jgi:predicted RNA-binding Zn-ribbon protein involved in translation (DUF1610 family)
MNTLSSITVGVFVVVFIVIYAMNNGWLTFLDKLIDKPLRLGRRSTASEVVVSKSEPYVPRKHEALIFVIFGLLTFKVAYYISTYLFLCYLYGFSRVYSESLRLTYHSGHEWIVSNGDQIDRNLHPLLFVICAVIWVVPTFVGGILILRLLPKRNPSATYRCANSETQKHFVPKPMERRLLVKKSRSFRVRGLIFFACWVFAMVPLFVFAHTIGRMVLFLIPSISIVIYIIYLRSHTRHFVTMMITTSCPQCGQVPMRYETHRVESGNCHLLICDKCRIEWDLGSV